MLNTGIEVEAKPGGKNVKKLSLLSGGERSLTALAYLFAVFRSRPSPFYVMDEVEAALDDVNLHRFLGLVQEFRKDAQLIVVSHQKRTMEAGDCLLGVSMQPGGSSKVVTERVSVASASAHGCDLTLVEPFRERCVAAARSARPVASRAMGIEVVFLILAVLVVVFGIGVVVVNRRRNAAGTARPRRPSRATPTAPPPRTGDSGTAGRGDVVETEVGRAAGRRTRAGRRGAAVVPRPARQGPLGVHRCVRRRARPGRDHRRHVRRPRRGAAPCRRRRRRDAAN